MSDNRIDFLTQVKNFYARLVEIATLVTSNDDIIQQKGGVWVNRTPEELAADLSSYIGGDVAGEIHAATAKPILDDADELGATDSANAWGLVKTTYANLKASLKTYFDTLYQVAGSYVLSTRSISTTAPLTGGGDLSTDRTIAIPAATASVNGYATATQITKLDGIAAAAQVNVLEGVTGTAPIVAGAVTAKSQAISISAATTSAAGSMSSTDKAKLDGIESGADVTDATNVDAAGAVMNSDYNANSILAATTDNVPAVLTVAEQTLLGRITGGAITALSAALVRTLLNVADGANAYVHPNHTGDVASVGDGVLTIGARKVSAAKMTLAAYPRLLGRVHDTNTQAEELTVGDGLEFGGVGGAVVQVPDRGISNAKLANMPTLTIKARVSALTGIAEDATVAQILAMLAIRHILPFASYNVISPLSTSPLFPYAATLPSATIYPKQYNQGLFIGATNDGSNYWTIDLLATISGTDSVIASFTTVGMTANAAGIKTTTTFSPTSLTQSNIRLAVRATKTGSPSNLYVHGPALEFTYAP